MVILHGRGRIGIRIQEKASRKPSPAQIVKPVAVQRGNICQVRAVNVLDWLLDSDPAIRWQVLRDLADASADVFSTERTRVANEGWGARLLALQGEDGQWAGGALFPNGKWN